MNTVQLFELSLAIGESIDMRRNCERFLSALMTVKQLTYASVWIRSQLLADPGSEPVDTATLLYARPWERFTTETMPADHPVFRWLQERDAISLAPPDERFFELGLEKPMFHGAAAVFALGTFGFLKMHSSHRSVPFTDAELTELSNLVFKFTVSLEGCVAHHRLQREVTLRRRAEAVTRHGEERLRALIENALDLIMVLEYDGRVRFASPSLVRILGHSPSDLEGTSLFSLVHPEDVSGALAAFTAQAREPGMELSLEMRLRHRNGSWRELSARANNLLSLPSVAGVILNCNDITDLKERTAELEEARLRAQAADRAKGEFLANMSHEIRTPMNAVIGMANLLLDSRLDSVQREQAEAIRSSGEALLSIVNDILDFSRIESGRLEVDETPFAPRECFESVLDLLAAPAAAKGLELVLELGPGLPGTVVGDEGRVRQVLVNLVGNAVKFTEEGTVRVVADARPAEDGRLVIQVEVSDTGIGIPPEDLERLFQPFSQADGSTTRRYGGSGLGLAICRRLCELMDGRVWVESVPGKGSTFGFTVMVREAAPAAEPLADDDGLRRVAGRRLLVVEDHADVRGLLVASARSWGMEVREAESRDQVEALLRGGERFDVALVDVTRPELEGAEIARQLARDGELRLIRLAAVTMATANPAPPFVATLTKPIRPDRLLRALATALAGASPVETPPVAAAGAPRVMVAARVLVAEDNPVNLKLALMMLERLGCRADTATDGHAVLEAVAARSYDLVLMDVQMPGMDGFEATRRLTEMLGEARPRVVAMTAHALAGDRERCLAAGMDDYLSKPILLDDLRRVLVSCSPHREPVGPAVDRQRLDQLRAWCGGDGHLIRELVGAFETSSRRFLDEIRRAEEGRHAEALREGAHSLKGGCLNVGAVGAAEVCRRLEEAAAGSSSESLAELVEQLEVEIGQVIAALEQEGLASTPRETSDPAHGPDGVGGEADS